MKGSLRVGGIREYGYGLVDGMDEYRMARRVLMAKVSVVGVRNRRRLGSIDGGLGQQMIDWGLRDNAH